MDNRILNDLIFWLYESLAPPRRKLVAQVKRYQERYSGLSDDALRKATDKALDAIEQEPSRSRVLRWVRTTASLFSSRPGDGLLNAIAALAEVFSRAPADLAETAGDAPRAPIFLFPEQISAAISLFLGNVVQMDTGEGKTYAILPASVCLLRKHGKVVIISANAYLAERDARRTQNFWQFLGITADFYVEGSARTALRSQIVYTTLKDFVFLSMAEDTQRAIGPDVMIYGAVIVDEADAVLIDQAFEQFTTVAQIKRGKYDWETAGQVAMRLVAGDHIEEDYAKMDATLTLDGEHLLREFLTKRGIAPERFLNFRHAVELAYVGLKMARPGAHYIVMGRSFVAVDLTTGLLNRNQRPDWLRALEGLKSGEGTSPVELDNTSAILTLRRFAHICGLSGTIRDDALEYALVYGVPLSALPPRKARYNTVPQDLVFVSKPEALEAACARILADQASGRPVLVGTQEVGDAEELYRMLRSHAPPDKGHVNLLTGRNDFETAELLRNAGEAGNITISTQLAGRGVDIRLSDDARRAGGLSLVGIGRHRTRRADRQFLGRAGRQGDPFTAIFFMSLEDMLFKMVGGQAMRPVLHRMGIERGEPIEHPWLTNAIALAQSKIAFNEWRRRWTAMQVSDSRETMRKRMIVWYSAVMLDAKVPGPFNVPPLGFLHAVADSFVELRIAPSIAGRRTLRGADADEIYNQLQQVVGAEAMMIGADVEGRDAEGALRLVAERLCQLLERKVADYQKRAGALLGEFLNAPASELTQRGQELGLIARRGPLDCVREVLKVAWMDALDEVKRRTAVLLHRQMATLEYYRAVSEEISAISERLQLRLTETLVKVLLVIDRPEGLDELFALSYQMVNASSETPKQRPQGPQVHALLLTSHQRLAQAEQTENTNRIIAEFLDSASGKLFEGDKERRRIEPSLRVFLDQFPLANLRSGTQVVKAIQWWQEAAIGPSDRSKRQRVLNQFLRFLEARRLIPQAPRVRHFVRDLGAGVVGTLGNVRKASAFGILIFCGLAIWGLSAVHFGRPLAVLTPWLHLLDTLVFGGLLSNASYAAPAICGLALATAFMNLMRSRATPEDNLRQLGIVVWISVGALAAFMILLNATPWDWRLVPEALGFIVVNVVLCQLGRLALSTAADEIGISGLYLWFSYCSLLFVVQEAQVAVFPLWAAAAIAGISVLYELRTRWLRFSLRTSFERTVSIDSMQAELLEGDLSITPGRSAFFHLAAAAAVLLAAGPLLNALDPLLAEIAIAGIYFLVASLLIGLGIFARTNVAVWRKYLLQNREQIAGDTDLKSELRRARIYLIALELLLLAFVVVALSLLQWYMRLWPAAQLLGAVSPLLAIAGAVVLCDAWSVSLSQIYRFLINRNVREIEPYEAASSANDEEGSRRERIMRFVERWLLSAIGLTVFAWKIFEAISEALDAVWSHH
ncbi:MAG: DEAD/DEAH box helicase [Rhizomicrobium sp.]